MKEIGIPFGAHDSELKGWEYTIPEGMEAEIKDGKIVVREKQPELTEFEQGLINFYNERNVILPDEYGVFNNYSHVKLLHESAKELLELAKKELIKQWDVDMKNEYERGKRDGLTLGYNKAMKEYNESVAYHYPTYEPPCFHGGICTNPFRDCVNCPRTGGDIGISTTSGTCKKD